MTLLKFLPNLRTEVAAATTGYTWGKEARHSRILEILKNVSGDTISDPNTIIAERWLVSDDPELSSQLQDSAQTFRQLLDKSPDEILGPEHLATYGPYLTCVMKQLDTNSDPRKGSLSVQIHPQPGHPTRPAKPEMWLGEGNVYLGWQKNVTAEEITAAWKDGTLEELLNQIELKKDLQILVEGGMIHAIRADSFLYEWSLAPGKDDASKGSLKDCTVSPYDRTDGKTPRPGKEDLAASLQLLTESDGFKKTDPTTVFAQPQVLTQENGATHELLFATREVFVERITFEDKFSIENLKRGFPLYCETGSCNLFSNNESIGDVAAGEEAFVSFSNVNITFKNNSSQPTKLYRWYAPFAGEKKKYLT